MNRALSSFYNFCFRGIVNKRLMKTVIGMENIPKLNMIVAANHQSHMDQLITGYVCVPKPYTYIGQTDKYTGMARIILRILYFIHGAIPINRKDENSRKEAVEKAVKALKKGTSIVIYPEGTRSRSGELQEGRYGAAKLFLRTGVPILPIGIKGTAELMPIGQTYFKIEKKIELNVGKPLYFEKEFKEAQNLDENSPKYQEISKEIIEKVMQEIANLRNSLDEIK